MSEPPTDLQFDLALDAWEEGRDHLAVKTILQSVRYLVSNAAGRIGLEEAMSGTRTASIQHVVPVDDVIDHVDRDCPCVPVREQVEGGWLVSHNAMDGRGDA